MRALVVYESAWGNTRSVAEAVAEGLRHGPHAAAVEAVEVGVAPPLAEVDVDLLVVGGPTHAFGMSKPATREDAARRAAGDVVSKGIGIREWLEAGAGPVPDRLAVTTFDTHTHKPNLPGWAGRSAARRLRRLGCRLVAPAETFEVHGYEGPLLPGELERARIWGTRLAAIALVAA